MLRNRTIRLLRARSAGMQDQAREHLGVLFPTIAEPAAISKNLLWLAIGVAFLIANAPPERMAAVLFKALTWMQARSSGPLFVNPEAEATQIAEVIGIPLKEPIFLAALIVMLFPVLKSLSQSGSVWRGAARREMLFGGSLYMALALLVFPYSYPFGLNSHYSGLSGLGIEFGNMSTAPFNESFSTFYKRLLKPSVAHFLQMDGHVLYYVFSLICTFVLIFLVVHLLNRFHPEYRVDGQPVVGVGKRWLLYLSLMTSSFVLVDFQWPGYSDSLSFILLLLMAGVPMTPQARLAIVALCVLNHESTALAMTPVILFLFPRNERLPALGVIALFFLIVAAGYGFSWDNALAGQETLSEGGAVWEAVLEDWGIFLWGLFFTYKLFWIVWALTAVMLWRTRQAGTAIAVLACTLFAVGLTAFAWDTTRVAGFGWFGVVLAVGVLLREYGQLSRGSQWGLGALVSVNVFIPSYNVVIFYRDSLSFYPYRGLYSVVDSVVRAWY